MITASRYHDICCGHRVSGHESKCKYLHGHNYRVHFVVGAPDLDMLGRILDFSVIKDKLCMWLENNYDHKTLIWEYDEMLADLQRIAGDSIVVVPFNPTAENIAKHMCEVVAIEQLAGTGCVLVECIVEETAKCSASYKII